MPFPERVRTPAPVRGRPEGSRPPECLHPPVALEAYEGLDQDDRAVEVPPVRAGPRTGARGMRALPVLAVLLALVLAGCTSGTSGGSASAGGTTHSSSSPAPTTTPGPK